MSTDQEYWDACLIKTWRNSGNIVDAMSMFYSVTGKRITGSELLRIPAPNFPWRVGIRVFVAQFLPKINDRLWDQPPEKDVALLKKLSTSKYDTSKQPIKSEADKELAKERRQYHKNKLKVGMNTTERNNRAQATEWGVTKAPQSKIGGRTRRYG